MLGEAYLKRGSVNNFLHREGSIHTGRSIAEELDDLCVEAHQDYMGVKCSFGNLLHCRCILAVFIEELDSMPYDLEHSGEPRCSRFNLRR